MAQQKKPSFQFYPGDWMKDPALRSCSHAARGLWIDMLCLMFESPRRGYLQQANGQPTTTSQVARMTGCDSAEAAHLLQELEDSGVLSRTEHGVYFSRRMVRDESKREKCAEAGKRGGGNPALVSTYKGHSKGSPIGRSKGELNPSSSSSTSVVIPPDPPKPKPPGPERPAAWVGGWARGIEVLAKAGVRIGEQLAAEARQVSGADGGDAWAMRVAGAVATACEARGTLSDPAGAIVFFLRRGSWPVDGVEEVAKAAKHREHRAKTAFVGQDVGFQFSRQAKAMRRSGATEDQMRARLIEQFGAEAWERFGWGEPAAAAAS